MGRLKIGGTLLYDDLRTPVPNATLQIYNLDQGGNGHDLIFRKRTGADGKFGVTSSDWNDRNTTYRLAEAGIVNMSQFELDWP